MGSERSLLGTGAADIFRYFFGQGTALRQSTPESLDEPLIPLTALCLGRVAHRVGQWRRGREPELDEQRHSFGGDSLIALQTFDGAGQTIEAADDCCFFLVGTVRREIGRKRRLDDGGLRYFAPRCQCFQFVGQLGIEIDVEAVFLHGGVSQFNAVIWVERGLARGAPETISELFGVLGVIVGFVIECSELLSYWRRFLRRDGFVFG